MKPIAKDADGRGDQSISFWWGVGWIGTAGLMYMTNIGDMGLQVFTALTGLIPMVLGFALTPRRP